MGRLVGSVMGLLPLLLMPFFVTPVMADPCGGVIDCECGDTVMNSYKLVYDLNCSSGGGGLAIGSRNIVLDCAGFSIIGDGNNATDDVGISNSEKDNVTLSNCNIFGFSRGVFIQGSSGSFVQDNVLEDSVVYDNSYHFGISSGASLYYVNNTTLKNSRFFNNQRGIDLSNSEKNTVSENTVFENEYGIWLEQSDRNNLSFNNASNNFNDGLFLWWSSDENTVHGNTVWYNYNDGIALSDTDPSGIWGTQTGCENNLLDSNHISDNTRHGIYSRGCEDSMVRDNIAQFSGSDGIFMNSSESSSIFQNRFVNNSRYGLSYQSSTSSITSNIVCGNDESDFHLDSIQNNSGAANTCDNPGDWNDTGYDNCTSPCFLGPKCSDLTPWGHCSDKKPLYCAVGVLVHSCSLCGCSDGRICNTATGSCYTQTLLPETCVDGTAYGECSVNKPLFCDEGILRNNCGTCGCPDNSSCGFDGVCQPACDDGTPYNHCSAIQPNYCDNGTVIDLCGSCGCGNDTYCNLTDHKCLTTKIDGSSCIADDECTSGNCFNDICRPSYHICDSDIDCSSESYCSNGACALKNPVGGNCTGDIHCGSGHCMQNNCVECMASGECGLDERCDNNVCVPVGISLSIPEQAVIPVGIGLALVVLAAMALFVYYTKRLQN